MPLEGPRYRSPLTSAPSATCAATGKSRSSPSRSCREKAKPGGGAGLTPQTPRMSFQGPTPPLRGGSLHSPRPLRGPTPPAPPAPGLLEPSPNPGAARFLLRRTPASTHSSSASSATSYLLNPDMSRAPNVSWGAAQSDQGFPNPGPFLCHAQDQSDLFSGNPRQVPPGSLNCHTGEGWDGRFWRH